MAKSAKLTLQLEKSTQSHSSGSSNSVCNQCTASVWSLFHRHRQVSSAHCPATEASNVCSGLPTLWCHSYRVMPLMVTDASGTKRRNNGIMWRSRDRCLEIILFVYIGTQHPIVSVTQTQTPQIYCPQDWIDTLSAKRKRGGRGRGGFPAPGRWRWRTRLVWCCFV